MSARFQIFQPFVILTKNSNGRLKYVFVNKNPFLTGNGSLAFRHIFYIIHRIKKNGVMIITQEFQKIIEIFHIITPSPIQYYHREGGKASR